MIQPKDQELKSTGPSSVWEAMLQVLLYCLSIISPIDTLIGTTGLDGLHREREPKSIKFIVPRIEVFYDMALS